MALFDSLGFRWDRDSIPRELPRASLNRVVFRFSRMLPEYVWDAGVLEGNPFTFPEVKTLLEGVTVGTIGTGAWRWPITHWACMRKR